ncbi:MAG TPA: hypothetical protein IGR64_02720, partial [Leptolyngbyaceae cyanobacterium M65_K2018_010]|nr:hypothetical protein [Leptolyngbyaceae cyanobacterium M65_K2018_010]
APSAPPPAEVESPYADFPHLNGAEAACGGVENCWRSPVHNWRAAVRSLQADLVAQGYQIEEISSETGVQIYAVTKSGQPAYFLNVISIDGGILYRMTTTPLTATEAMAMQVL